MHAGGEGDKMEVGIKASINTYETDRKPERSSSEQRGAADRDVEAAQREPSS